MTKKGFKKERRNPPTEFEKFFEVQIDYDGFVVEGYKEEEGVTTYLLRKNEIQLEMKVNYDTSSRTPETYVEDVHAVYDLKRNLYLRKLTENKDTESGE